VFRRDNYLPDNSYTIALKFGQLIVAPEAIGLGCLAASVPLVVKRLAARAQQGS
jgi:hypothetical protein